MSRAGRKRKAGKRHPSGELVRDKRPDDRIRASRQPHRRGLRDVDRLSEKAESPLGRLNLKGSISDEEYEGGAHYAILVGQYRSTIEAPKSTAGTGAGVGCIAERHGQADACRWDPDSCACLKRRDRYMRAFEALAESGRAALMAVNRVAVQREEPTPQGLVYLKAGLTALARHFGLTARRRREYSGNAH